MKIAKKPKAQKRPTKEPVEIVEDTNYLNLAIFIRVLNKDFGFGKKRLQTALESYLALMEEVADRRATVQDQIVATKVLTGIDCREFLNYVMSNQCEAWREEVHKC